MNLLQHDNRMTAREIAMELGCSVKTLYQWKYHGRHSDVLPLHKSAGGPIYAFREDVMRFKKEWIPRSKRSQEGVAHEA